MKLDGRNRFALLLIGLGVLFILMKAGFIVGILLGYLFPVALILLGYVGFRYGRKWLGLLFVIVGLIILFSKVPSLFGLLIALGLVFLGMSLYRGKGDVSYHG